MCFFQILLVSFVLYIATLVNFFPQYRYRKRVADCFLLKENLIKKYLRGALTTFLSSFAVALSFIWILFNAVVSWKKIALVYFLAVTVLTLLLHFRLRRFLNAQVPQEVADYVSFKLLPVAVTVFTIVPYAVIFYLSVPVTELVPVADPQRYLEILTDRYSYLHCSLFQHLAVWGDFLNYLVWSLVLSLSKLSGQFFLFAAFFLIVKGGFCSWVVARTILGALITVKTFKRKA